MRSGTKAFYFLLMLLVFQATLTDSNSITIRRDVDDTKYLELGKKYQAVCALGRAGDGTLIAPQWILTAAHVAHGLQTRGREITVRCGEADYKAEKILIHQQWTDMGPNDIALIKLTTPVAGIAPIKLFSEFTETSKTATIVGHGDTRTGNGGQWITDSLLRGATSKIERVDENWIYLTFHEPPNCTDLEGAPGRGDSGGPALIVLNGEAFVAGVSSLGTDGRNGPGTYGAEDSFVRVSKYTAWIKDVLSGGGEKGEITSSKKGSGSGSRDPSPIQWEFTKTAEGKIIAAYIAAFNSVDGSKMEAFLAANLSKDAIKRRPLAERLQVYGQMHSNLGGMEYRKTLSVNKRLVTILVKKKWANFRNLSLSLPVRSH